MSEEERDGMRKGAEGGDGRMVIMVGLEGGDKGGGYRSLDTVEGMYF